MRLFPRPGAIAQAWGRFALLLRPFGRTPAGPPPVGPLRLYPVLGGLATRDGRTSVLSTPFGRFTAAPVASVGLLRLYPVVGTLGSRGGRTALLMPPYGRPVLAGGTDPGGTPTLRLFPLLGTLTTKAGRAAVLGPPFYRVAAAPALSGPTGPGTFAGLCVGGMMGGGRVVVGGMGWGPAPRPVIYADIPTAARQRIKADPMLPTLAEVYYEAVPRLAPYPFVVASLISTSPSYTADRGLYLSDEVYQYDVLDTDELRGGQTRDRAAWLLSPGMPRMRIGDGYIVAIWPQTLGGFKQPGMGRRGLAVYHSLFQVTYTVARPYRRVQT